MPPQRNNVFGLVGFIVSLIGVATGGCFSPIGMVLSFIGLFQRPRGLAIAGFIIGFVFSIGFIILAIVFGAIAIMAMAVLAAGGVALFTAFGEVSQFQNQLDDYYQDNGVYPYALEEIDLDLADLNNIYGGGWVYERSEDGQAFSIQGPGPDGVADTEDDFALEVDTTSITLYHGGEVLRKIDRDDISLDIRGINGAESGGSRIAPPTPDAPPETP